MLPIIDGRQILNNKGELTLCLGRLNDDLCGIILAAQVILSSALSLMPKISSLK